MPVHFGNNTSRHVDSIDRLTEIRIARDVLPLELVKIYEHPPQSPQRHPALTERHPAQEPLPGRVERLRSIMLDNRQAMRIITSILYMAFALACFIVAVQNYSVASSGWIAPTHWLALDSAVSFTMAVTVIIYTLMGRYRMQYFIIFVTLALDAVMVVTGGISLWANNAHTQPVSVHDITTAALVIKICRVAFIVMCHSHIVD